MTCECALRFRCSHWFNAILYFDLILLFSLLGKGFDPGLCCCFIFLDVAEDSIEF